MRMPKRPRRVKIMTKVVVDKSLLEKLHSLTQPLELCDESGCILARVTPVYDPKLYGPLEPTISEEEIQRRIKSDKWYTTEEVLNHLKNLRQE
jgi:hypothetical protein